MEVFTPRLVIRSLRQSDIAPFASIVADPCVMKLINDGKALNYAEAEQYVRNCIERELVSGISRYAVCLRNSGDLIGMSGFKFIANHIDFGCRIARDFWNQGIATEAGRAAIDHGFEALELKEVVAGVRPENLPSIRVLKKLGFALNPHQVALERGYQWYIL